MNIKNAHIILLIGFLLPTLINTANGQTRTWNGSINNLFSEGGNWNEGSAPTASDNARFELSGTHAIQLTQDIESDAIGVQNGTFTFTGTGTYDLSGNSTIYTGGTARFQGAGLDVVSNDGYVVITAGSLDVSDGATYSGNSNLYSGYYSSSLNANVNVSNGSSMQVDRLEIGRSSRGVVSVSGGSVLNATNSYVGYGGIGELVLSGMGTTFSSSSTLIVNGDSQSSFTIENGATAVVGNTTIGQGSMTVTDSGSTLETGTLYASGGNAYLDQGGVITCTTVNTSSGKGVVLSNGSTLSADSFSGNGFITVQSGSTLSSMGSSSIVNVTVRNSGSSWTVDSLSVSGQIKIESGGSLNSATAVAGDVRITGAGSNWQNTGTVQVSNTLRILDSAALQTDGLRVNSGKTMYIDNASVNAVDVEVQGFGSNRGMVNMVNSLLNATNLNNQGGRINADAGSIVTVDGTYHGNGDFLGEGHLIINGTLDFSSSIANQSTIDGQLTLGAASSSVFMLAQPSNYNRIYGVDQLNLAGSLTVNLDNRYSLEDGMEFLIFDSASSSGMFDGLGQDALVGQFGDTNLFISYTGGTSGNGVLLYAASTVPEPASFGLLGLAALGLILRRRRK